jgi:hypothetical protein
VNRTNGRAQQSSAIKAFLSMAGYNQQNSALLMGIEYGEWRKVVCGSADLTPYYIARMMSALLPPPASGMSESEVLVDVLMRYTQQTALLTAAAVAQWERARERDQGSWGSRPPPMAGGTS